MNDIHFVELAALTGDAAFRRKLKRVLDEVPAPTEKQVRAYLYSRFGFDREFTDDDRGRARDHLTILMAEDLLARGDDDDLTEDDWREEAAAAASPAPSVPGGPAKVNGYATPWVPPSGARRAERAAPAHDWAWSANDNAGAPTRPAGEPQGHGQAGPAAGREIIDTCKLESPGGEIQVGDDGEFIFVRLPEGSSAKALRLGDAEYALDAETGLAGVLRVSGLSKREMYAFWRAHLGDPSSYPARWVN